MGYTAVDVDTFVADYIRELSRHVQLDRVLLFGSYARGQAGPDSDVDLLVVSDDFAHQDYLEALISVRRDLPPGRDFDVDILIKTPAQLAAAEPDSFLATILEDAVVVYPKSQT